MRQKRFLETSGYYSIKDNRVLRAQTEGTCARLACTGSGTSALSSAKLDAPRRVAFASSLCLDAGRLLVGVLGVAGDRLALVAPGRALRVVGLLVGGIIVVVLRRRRAVAAGGRVAGVVGRRLGLVRRRRRDWAGRRKEGGNKLVMSRIIITAIDSSCRYSNCNPMHAWAIRSTFSHRIILIMELCPCTTATPFPLSNHLPWGISGSLG